MKNFETFQPITEDKSGKSANFISQQSCLDEEGKERDYNVLQQFLKKEDRSNSRNVV